MACDGMLGHGLLSRRQVMSVTVSLYVVHLAQRMAAVWIGFQFKHIQAYSVIPAGSTDTVLKQCEHGLPCLDSESIMPESVKLRWAEVNGFEFRHKGIEDSWNNLEQSGTHGWPMLRSRSLCTTFLVLLWICNPVHFPQFATSICIPWPPFLPACLLVRALHYGAQLQVSGRSLHDTFVEVSGEFWWCCGIFGQLSANSIWGYA